MDIAQYLSEKIAQHTDNLHLWENGYLNPTEPDEQERECVMRELKAVISELTFIRTLLPNKHSDQFREVTKMVQPLPDGHIDRPLTEAQKRIPSLVEADKQRRTKT